VYDERAVCGWKQLSVILPIYINICSGHRGKTEQASYDSHTEITSKQHESYQSITSLAKEGRKEGRKEGKKGRKERRKEVH